MASRYARSRRSAKLLDQTVRRRAPAAPPPRRWKTRGAGGWRKLSDSGKRGRAESAFGQRAADVPVGPPAAGAVVDLVFAIDRVIAALGGIELLTERQHFILHSIGRTHDEVVGFQRPMDLPAVSFVPRSGTPGGPANSAADLNHRFMFGAQTMVSPDHLSAGSGQMESNYRFYLRRASRSGRRTSRHHRAGPRLACQAGARLRRARRSGSASLQAHA